MSVFRLIFKVYGLISIEILRKGKPCGYTIPYKMACITVFMGHVGVLGGLFLTAFVAATFFPAQSEALLTMLILKGDIPVWVLVLVASIGNILGSCVNWILGRGFESFKSRKWFPVSEKSLAKGQAYYRRYGRWSLLLSWVPIIGDPITVVAGIMRERFLVFLTFVSVAKAGRYIALALLTLKIAHATS